MARKISKPLLLVSVATLLSACGSSDNSDSGTAPVDTKNTAPVAVIDKTKVTALFKKPVTASAKLSFDEDGDKLTYQWTIEQKPDASKATIAAPGSETLSFTPDVAGQYSIGLTVNDGKASNKQTFSLNILGQASAKELSFVPLQATYSAGLDKLIAVDGNPDSLRIVDPYSGVTKSVLLSDSVVSLTLSPNGKLAAVLHPNHISLVDLEKAQIVATHNNEGPFTDVFLRDDSTAYLVGQRGSSFSDAGVVRLDFKTSKTEKQLKNARLFADLKGVYASKKDKLLLSYFDASPRDIFQITFNKTTGDATSYNDSPYHGDFDLGKQLYLNENQNILFTSTGNYFYTSTLKYAGALDLGTQLPFQKKYLLSLSQLDKNNELIALPALFDFWENDIVEYPPTYRQYTGVAYGTVIDLPFAKIDGQQSYGMQLFHNSNGNHIALVQTGSNKPLAFGVKYYITLQ